MLHRVGGHVDISDIVTEDDTRYLEGVMNLKMDLVDPTTLCHGVGEDRTLHFNIEVGDSSLTLGGPRRVVVSEIWWKVGDD